MKFPAETSPVSPRLSTTLATAFFALSVVVLLLYGGMETFRDFKTHEEIVSSKQQIIAQDAAKTVSGFIDENFSILEAAIWLTDLDVMEEIEQRQVLQSLLGLRPALRRLVLLNTRNEIRAQSSRLSAHTTSQFTDRLKGIMPELGPAAKRIIGPVYIDSVTSEPMVAMAVPVTDVFGDFKGSLIAELNLKSMWDIVDHIRVGETGYVYVSDRKGNLLAFHDTALVLRGQNVAHLRAVADFIQNHTGAQPNTAKIYQGITGLTVVGTYTSLKKPDWAVVIEIPLKEAYREVAHDVAMAVGITLAAAILAGIFGIFVARRLAVPVINLTEIASRIAAGERDLRAAVSGPSEVAHLATAFNSMTADLRQSLKDLEQRYSDLERTEEALRLSEERLRLALEGASDGIWDWNLQTGQVYFSPQYYTMMGYDPDEFPAAYETWRQMIHPNDVGPSEAAVHRAIEEHSSFTIEFRFKAKSGEWLWIMSRGKAAELDADGSAVRVAGSHSDITQRKRAEEALRKYERIVSTSQDLMAMVSREYVFEAVNESLLAAHGRTWEDVVGRKVSEIMGETVFREKIKPRLDAALSGTKVNYQEAFAFAGFGRRIMDITYFPLVDETGKVEGVVLNSRDITETRKLEEQLMQSQRIESIGTLAGGVAHEINNPINGIMNYAQLILDRIEQESPAREFAREILHETQRVTKIVRNLLTFARHEKQSHSPALLSDIVSSVLSLVQTVMRHDQIVLELSVPEDLPKIKCRSQQIQQVLMNLMTNARDALNERYPGYSPEKKLRVVAELTIKHDRRFIRTTVEDSGPGIPVEIRDRIFDPFFTTKPKERGTGLGLSISYGIVKDHGGELSVESEPGRYTRFCMDLPVNNGWTLPGV
jgi:PAS domain S-box-containing protein